MKHFIKLIAILCLAVMALSVFTACSNTPSLTQAQKEEIAKHEKDLTTYTQNNTTIMEAVAQKLLTDNVTAFYSVSPLSGAGEGICKVYQFDLELDKKIACDDQTLLALGPTSFHGDISYIPHTDAVIFRPAQQPSSSNVGLFIVYCASEKGVNYAKTELIPDAKRITATPVEDNWYIVTAQ